MISRLILFCISFSFSFSQYDYSLEDVNASSVYYGNNVGTSYFTGKVTMHYFGHYN